MKDIIEILDSDLVEKHGELLAFIDHWKTALDLTIGWHYDLDLIWILDNIEALHLPSGATILDAGAGNGLLQFLLAAKGYRVVSADFAERDIPWAASHIFRMSHQESPKYKSPEHRYQDFIDHRARPFDRARGARIMGHPLRSIRRLAECARGLLHPIRWQEILHANAYGDIVYRTADFTNMAETPAGHYDCVVSVSAIEHNDSVAAKKAAQEFERVTKKGGALLITTSAARDTDTYLEFCQGWCFSRNTLAGIFSMPEARDNYADYDRLLGKLVRNETIRKRIPRLYFENGDNGLPFGRYPPLYQPVGVRKIVG